MHQCSDDLRTPRAGCLKASPRPDTFRSSSREPGHGCSLYAAPHAAQQPNGNSHVDQLEAVLQNLGAVIDCPGDALFGRGSIVLGH
jgi:hypothetical protein